LDLRVGSRYRLYAAADQLGYREIAEGAKRHAYHFAQVLRLAFKVGVRDHWIAPERPPRAA